MLRLEHSVVINRPIEEVFTFVSDVEKHPQWEASVVETKIISEGPVVVGTTFSAVVKFLGRRIESTLEVTEYEPHSKFAYKVTSGPIPMESEYTFESVAGGTKLSILEEAEVGGFFRLAEPIVARMAQRQLETNFDTMKDLLEAQA